MNGFESIIGVMAPVFLALVLVAAAIPKFSSGIAQRSRVGGRRVVYPVCISAWDQYRARAHPY